MLQQIETISASPANSPTPPSFVPAAAKSITRRSAKSSVEPLRTSTAKAYTKDARLFMQGGGSIPCDAIAIKKYVWSIRNKIAPATIYRRLMAVRHAHLSMGKPSPTDDAAIRPLLRALQLGYVPDKEILHAGVSSDSCNAKPRKPKPSLPVTRRLLGRMMEPLPRNLLDRRDRALILLGFAGALKRGALVAINVGDVRFTADALIVRIRDGGAADGVGDVSLESSDNKESGRHIAIPITGGELCAATAVQTWIEMAALDTQPADSPLFRRFDRGGDPTADRLQSAFASVVVKKWVAATGIDSTPYSAHSLIVGRRGEMSRGML
jgi:integrase